METESKAKPQRGRLITAEKRALDYPDDMVARGDEMWCKHCGVVVNHAQVPFSTKHIASKAHKKHKANGAATKVPPGATAQLADPVLAPPAKPAPTLHQQQQASMQTMMDKLNTTAKVSDDFVAAFLQAGIPPNKLDHPAIRGLIKKYTTVHGSVSHGSTLYRNVSRVGATHMAAVRAKVQGKKVWIATDEWTDSLGHAILNIIVGTVAESWVCATISLTCKGPNDGVEHTEVAKALCDTITSLGISSSDVVLFICDAASVLTAAYTHVLAPLFPTAKHITCPSHGLNLVGKAMVAELPSVIVDIYNRGPPILHAKKYASCRRRWFAFCKGKGIAAKLPPKHVDTRWVVWRTCGEWWVEYYTYFLQFLEAEAKRYKEGKVPLRISKMIEIMTATPRGTVAAMVFMIEETNALDTLLNLSQERNHPVAPVFMDKMDDLLQSLDSRVEAATLHPRVVSAMSTMPSSTKSEVNKMFLTALKAGADKLRRYMEDRKSGLDFYRRLRVLDPRNIRGMNMPWSSVRDLFGPPHNGDDDEDLAKRKAELDDLLASEWNRYTRLESCTVHSHQDLVEFWKARGTLMYDAVAPYLWYPTSAAVVERSFSLAGLIDTKNRQRMSNDLRATAVAMFCNGDVEQRWTS